MTLVFWILGINFAMVVVGLLGQYLVTELLIRRDEEPKSVWLWLHEYAERLEEVYGKAIMACSIFVGPVAFVGGILFFRYFLEERRRGYGYPLFQPSNSDDTQELPMGTTR